MLQPKEIEARVEKLRTGNKTIVTLNGSFDLFHSGHLQIIYEASLQGDILIVALNSDFSIKKYKGPKRPIITLEDRIQMMAALSFVDYVTYFDEIDPIAILEKIKPDVHVNGSEYGKSCVEAGTIKKNGGKLYLVGRLPSLSTTNIIEKIKCDL